MLDLLTRKQNIEMFADRGIMTDEDHFSGNPLGMEAFVIVIGKAVNRVACKSGSSINSFSSSYSCTVIYLC